MSSCLSLGIEMPLSFSFRIRGPVSKLSWGPDEILGLQKKKKESAIRDMVLRPVCVFWIMRIMRNRQWEKNKREEVLGVQNNGA